jgi:hypothetical protein
MKKSFKKDIKIYDAKTTPLEIIQESLINFIWGFTGNSIVVFISKQIDIAVLLNFILYYIFISFIINRAKYETKLGKFVIQPFAAALGAYSGYIFAKWIVIYL